MVNPFGAETRSGQARFSERWRTAAAAQAGPRAGRGPRQNRSHCRTVRWARAPQVERLVRCHSGRLAHQVRKVAQAGSTPSHARNERRQSTATLSSVSACPARSLGEHEQMRAERTARIHRLSRYAQGRSTSTRTRCQPCGYRKARCVAPAQSTDRRETNSPRLDIFLPAARITRTFVQHVSIAGGLQAHRRPHRQRVARAGLALDRTLGC